MRRSLILILMISGLFVNAQDWEPDFDQALQKAMTENKILVLVFAGSDWCAPCIRLDREIWSQPEFIDYAKGKYVMYKADFPRKKGNRLPEGLQIKNAALAEKYNPKGYFPWVVLLDGSDAVLGATTYKKMNVSTYIEHLNSFVK